MRYRSRTVAALALAIAMSAAWVMPANAATNLSAIQLGVTKRWTGLDQPLYLTAPKDGSGRVFILEKTGRVRVVRNGKLLTRPYLDLRAKLTSVGNERGLLGMAFSPTFKTDGRFYVNYTDKNGDTIVERYYTASRASDRPTFSSRVILKVAQPYEWHNGGCMQFGPDGYLYIGMGDGGGIGDPGNRAQNRGLLLGKILRIDTGDKPGSPYSPTTYRIPPSNPFVGRAGYRPEIWALGLRNPWRFSFDPIYGHMWIGDVGQDGWEEIDFQYAGYGGNNYGWKVFEGTHPYPPGSGGPPDATLYTMPIFEGKHEAWESIIGGYVYRGSKYPKLQGVYVFGDFVTGEIWGMRRVPTAQKHLMLDTSRLISSFGVSATGELYLCDMKGGSVYRVTAK